jgi:hypothetical protein
MLLWRILWKAEALVLALILGCASIPRVPVVEDTGQGKAVVHIPRTADLQPVELEVAAIGSTAQLFAAKVPTLPGSAQVAMQAEVQAGISLPALGAVEEISVSAEGVSIALPANAVAMSARPSRGNGPCVETHHIATICNDKDTKRGGPWTPRFRAIFAKAGMSMEDPANKLPLPGHYGPHPQRYHELVLQELLEATKTCRSVVDCRERLTRALKALVQEVATPGTELNQLVTRQPPR